MELLKNVYYIHDIEQIEKVVPNSDGTIEVPYLRNYVDDCWSYETAQNETEFYRIVRQLTIDEQTDYLFNLALNGSAKELITFFLFVYANTDVDEMAFLHRINAAQNGTEIAGGLQENERRIKSLIKQALERTKPKEG